MKELLVILPVSTAYREPFFNRAVPLLARADVNLTIAHGHADQRFNARGDSVTSDWSIRVPVRSGPGRLRVLEYRSWRACGIRPDLVVVQQSIKNLETYPLLARQYLGGPSVAMWGHGRSFSTPQGPAMAAAKQFLTRRCDWFFAYTQAGADHVVAHGYPASRVSVLNNTVDAEALQRDLAAITDQEIAVFSRSHGLTSGRTALFLGGVDEAKGIDFLLESARQAARMLPGFVLLVGGAGQQLVDVQAAERAGFPVRALGRLDGLERALALRSSDVLALPSSVGLVAVDSLVAGVPVVTRDNHTHGPEADYLVNGRTSRWIGAECTASEYAAELAGLLNDVTALHAMHDACLAEVPKYGLDCMVRSFVEGVFAWEDVARSGRRIGLTAGVRNS
jgi:glycosyltransferase involved in cell wall biosynthesis